jgi:hypothetical protein
VNNEYALTSCKTNKSKTSMIGNVAVKPGRAMFNIANEADIMDVSNIIVLRQSWIQLQWIP